MPGLRARGFLRFWPHALVLALAAIVVLAGLYRAQPDRPSVDSPHPVPPPAAAVAAAPVAPPLAAAATASSPATAQAPSIAPATVATSTTPDTVVTPPAAASGKAPIAALPEILASDARELRVFRPAGNENILVFKFATLGDQARALNRVATFIEEKGAPKQRILSEPELADYVKAHGATPESFYMGHDYSAAELVRFFASAAHDSLALNADEEAVRRILIEEGAIRLSNLGYEEVAPAKALISFAQRQRPDATDASDPDYASLRYTIIQHELSHGIYFTNSIYSGYCIEFWHHGLTEAERASFRAFLGGLGYDTDNEEIDMNEMQAFLMHTPDPRAFSAKLLRVSDAELRSLRERFAQRAPTIPLLLEIAGLTPH